VFIGGIGQKGEDTSPNRNSDYNTELRKEKANE